MSAARIIATVCSLLALTGGADLARAGKPGGTPTYPPARDSQGFTSNGGTTATTSRLYMFGGNKDGTAIRDLWVYANAGSTGATWTYIPGGRSAPSARASPGLSCGRGLCVVAGGVSTSYKADTWIFNESAQTWVQVSCRRVLCPSARSASAMAYDPDDDVHVLFGGDASGTLVADTYTFNASTKTWKQFTGGTTPTARFGATAAFVPEVGVVMFGGADNSSTVFSDMYIWDGTAWAIAEHDVNGSTPPALWGHSMAWDAQVGALMVAGGLFDTSWSQPNSQTWYVTFSNSGGKWKAAWTSPSPQPGCQAVFDTSPDWVVHRGARMAYDGAANVQVFFGGMEDDTLRNVGNTVECH